MAQPIDIIVQDILGAIEQAQSFMGDLTFAQYEQDLKTQRAVERCLEVISEASRRIPHKIKMPYRKIPWRDIAGIGNILRHDYRLIANRIIWDTVSVHLPKLLEVMRAIKADVAQGT